MHKMHGASAYSIQHVTTAKTLGRLALSLSSLLAQPRLQGLAPQPTAAAQNAGRHGGVGCKQQHKLFWINQNTAAFNFTKQRAIVSACVPPLHAMNVQRATWSQHQAPAA